VPQNFFDYIHARNISSGVSDWNHLISQMMRYVNPLMLFVVSANRRLAGALLQVGMLSCVSTVSLSLPTMVP
jgi:hypothetical protein